MRVKVTYVEREVSHVYHGVTVVLEEDWNTREFFNVQEMQCSTSQLYLALEESEVYFSAEDTLYSNVEVYTNSGKLLKKQVRIKESFGFESVEVDQCG